jgi:hypothetical protein
LAAGTVTVNKYASTPILVGFAGDWAINKNRHMLFGIHFVWVMDCYAVCFILSYDGNNPAILWLQMQLMCWDIDIIHQKDMHLANADYWATWQRHLL